MKRLQNKPLATIFVFAAGTAALCLAVLWPRPTLAEEIPDDERQGEYEDLGMKFGNIVVKGELVADVRVPGGWALVRTLENKSDEPESCTVEERVLRTETMPEARVTPAPTPVVLRNQRISLGPHEKRTIGIALPRTLGEQITAGILAKASIERDRDRAIAAEKWDSVNLTRTYMAFHVEYLKPLPPGAKAAPHTNTGIVRPERMPM